ncbi:MAG: lipoate--protein ligase [Planctomycetota bacterium]
MIDCLIDNQGCHDPSWNLALEEFSVRHLDGGADTSYLLLYVNGPSVIVGRNQNTLEEIDPEFVDQEGVRVVRRISGGGAVYHDLGNLNFSFIKRFRPGARLEFKEFTDPIVAVLHRLGVDAELTGRNDIVVAGRKISGNAQFTTSRRMFSHGTLLFDSDLDRVTQALRPRFTKIESKGLKSIRSRVANISEFLPRAMDLGEFRDLLVEGLFGTTTPPVRQLDAQELERVQQLADSKYRQWNWNFGESPRFNVRKVHRFSIGELDARIDVQAGRIESCRIYGDFLGFGEISEIEWRLVGVRYEPADLAEALAEVDVESYFGGLSRAEFVEFLF